MGTAHSIQDLGPPLSEKMECFVARPLESDAVVLSVALSPGEDMASNHVELIGCAGHGIHA
jgi:hypothetical protein